jgi:cyclic-di-GMP phosphodiesterase, flagellum assembly factor TipF
MTKTYQRTLNPQNNRTWVPISIAVAASCGGVGCALALPTLGLPIGAAVGVGLCVIALGAFAAGFIGWQSESQSLSQRMGDMEHTVETLTRTVDTVNSDVSQLEAHVEGSATDKPEVAAELRVLSELLAQVISRRTVTPLQLEDHSSAVKMGKRLGKMRTEPERDVLNIMRQSLADNRVDLYLQPTVKLPSRRTAYYEAFSRVRDEFGNIIFPCDFLETVERAGLVATLDNLLLFRCITLMRTMGLHRQTPRLFINISASSLRDKAFLAEFVSYIVEHRGLASRLVFEISADTLSSLGADVRTHLDRLSKAGFAFSVDQVSSLAIDVLDIASLNVHYLKIDAAILLQDPTAANSLAMSLARYGIDMIATHIETEATVVEILEIGVEFGQGYLFGEPKISDAVLSFSAQAA